MRAVTVPLVTALLVGSTLAVVTLPAVAGDSPAPPPRFVLPVDGQGDVLGSVLGLPGAEVVRVDRGLGFAVVRAADAGALRAAVDVPVTRDARATAANHLAGRAHWPDDPEADRQWAIPELNMPQAWAIEPGDTSIEVAVVDSGVDLDHPDLAPAGDDRVVEGWDYVEGDPTPQDEHGHGTLVAGTVGAVRDNGVDVAGMAPVQLRAIRVLDEHNHGHCSDVASAVDDAVANGSHVVLLALTCSVHSPPLKASVSGAVANGSLVVAAAGNLEDDAPQRCVAFPARYDETLAVGALEPTLQPTDESCRGDALNLTAPGDRIRSTTLGGGTGVYGRTSAASAHVAGVAGLLAAHDATLDGSELGARLETHARDLGLPGDDPRYGEGMVDPPAALTRGCSVWLGFHEDCS